MGRDFLPVQTGPGAHPASCTMCTGSFTGAKYGRGVLLTTHSLLVPRSCKSTAIFLPTLWATTRPVNETLNLLCAFSWNKKKGLVSKMYNTIVVNYFTLTEFKKVARNEIYHVQCPTQNVGLYTFTNFVLCWHQSAGQNVCG